jgi:hypothetical protein
MRPIVSLLLQLPAAVNVVFVQIAFFQKTNLALTNQKTAAGGLCRRFFIL